MTDLTAMSDEELLAAYRAVSGPAKPPKLSAQEAAQLRAAREAAQSGSAAARDAQRFMEINQQVGTGEIWSIPLASEIRGAFDPRFASMQALTNRMAPMQRQAGSGATSDKDVALFKRSVPNPDFTGPTNAMIAGRIKDEAQRAQGYAAFLDEYAATNGTLLGAEAAWAKRQSAPKPPKKADVPKATRSVYEGMIARGEVDRSQPMGTMANPFVARDEATARRLPRGSYIILNGALVRKD